MKTIFLVVAAGKGKRFGLKFNKLFYEIQNKPLIYFTLKNISKCNIVDSIILIVNKQDKTKFNKIIKKYNFSKVIKIIEGGKERQDSVFNGLKFINKHFKNKKLLTAIHDGARINISSELIRKVIKTAEKYKGAAPAAPVSDTVKEIDSDLFVKKTVPRDNLVLIKTPQIFMFNDIFNAYKSAYEKKLKVTDDVAVFEAYGKTVKIVPDNSDNIKITYKTDIENIIKKYTEYRTGFGYDVHKFTEKRKLILGGIKIPYSQGLEGHSDADVLIHAIIDALLGAAGMRDIGYHFPDSDNSFKNIKSTILLKKTYSLLLESNFNIINIDSTLILEKPKLKKFIPEMRSNIAKILNIDESKINIKATTTEGLGFTGRKEGIAAQSICMLSFLNI